MGVGGAGADGRSTRSDRQAGDVVARHVRLTGFSSFVALVHRRVSPRLVIVAATAGSLVLAFTISAFWFGTTSGTSRFEPAGHLGLLAGITGVVAERRAAARERREQALLGC